MKALINYVVQGDETHVHQSEILELMCPPYSFSPEVPMSEVMLWYERKKNKLLENQNLVIKSMYKI
jgi:hypothetical protein